MCTLFCIVGDARDSGILPRSLEVVFNSISGSEYTGINLKPDSFCDIVRLNVDQEQAERRIKQAVLSMSLNTVSYLADEGRYSKYLCLIAI